ncbi:phage tail tape measure protein [Aliarcobacter cryaerophilus]|uniref:phage tail tape measure protein n=1 Tax=Aliarcobacter cryaerophilus TaxID=28198 RepID=UPI00317D3BC2
MSLKTTGLMISIGAIFTGATALSATTTAITKLETSIKKIETKQTKLQVNSIEYDLAQKKVTLLNNSIDKLKSNRAKIEVNNAKMDEFEKTMGKRTALAVTTFAPVYKAINFEDSMADVKKVLNGVSKEEFKVIEQDILKLGKSFSVPLEELATITASGGKLGIAKNNLVDFTSTVSKMVVAFDVDAKVAGDAAAKIMDNFKVDIKDLTAIGDAINHLSNQGSDAGEIIHILKETAGVTREFGLSAVQTSALAHTFLKVGKNGSTASTSINSILTKLSAASEQGTKFKDALAEIGLTGEGLQSNILAKPQEALEDFLNRINNLEREDKMGVLFNLFGMEYVDDVSLLAGNLDIYKKSLESVSDVSKYQGSLDEEYLARMDTVKSKLITLGNAFSAIAINIGNILLPVMNGLISVFGGVADVFDYGIKNFPFLTTVFTSIGFGAMSLAVIIPTLGYAWFFAQNGLLKFKSMLQVLTTLIKINTYTTAFSTVTTKAYAIAKGIATISVKAFTFAKVLATKAVSAFRFAIIATTVVTKFWVASLGLGAIASKGFAVATLFLSKAFNIAKIAVRSFLGATGIGLLLVAVGLIYEYWTPITNFFSNIWDNIKIGFKDGVNFITNVFTSPIETITTIWSSMFDWLSSKFEWIGKSIEWVKGVGSGIGDFFSSGKETIKNTALTTATATSLAIAPVPQLDLKEKSISNTVPIQSTINTASKQPNSVEHNNYNITINVTNPTSNVDIEKAVKKAIADLKRDNFNREIS